MRGRAAGGGAVARRLLAKFGHLRDRNPFGVSFLPGVPVGVTSRFLCGLSEFEGAGLLPVVTEIPLTHFCILQVIIFSFSFLLFFFDR